MNCYCGEKAFTFTKISCRDDKKITSLVGRCNRSLMDNSKKKKKCEYSEERVIDIGDLQMEEEKRKDSAVVSHITETRKDHLKSLLTAVNTVKTCQDVGQPFDKYINRILYLSHKLNIPPYIPETHTIEEYYDIASYYMKNPIPVRPPTPIKKYSIVPEFQQFIKRERSSDNYNWISGKRPKNFREPTSQELDEHFKKLLTVEKTVVKVKPVIRNIQKSRPCLVGAFKTGGTNVDRVLEDDLDIEEFDSEEEVDDFCDYNSD